MNIRAFGEQDRERVIQIVRSIDNFNEADVDIAIELIEDVTSKKELSDYILDVLVDDSDVIQGYVCYGKTPLTESTFDFYWMAIDPGFQHLGFGTILFQHVEKEVMARGGKRLMCETSSLEGYARVLKLYDKMGYEPVARIKDFYRDGDDKLMYMKVLG